MNDYLKLDCRRDFYELAKEWFDGAGEWCREHWKAVTTALIVIAAVALMCTGIGGILGAVALGALLGAGIGGLTGGILSAAMGGSFWEGVENGAFAGAVSGMIAGGMGYAMTGGAALSLGQSMTVGAVSGSGCSLITDLGAMVIGGERLSVGQVLLNLTVSGGMGAAFAGIGYGMSKAFTALKVKLWGGKGGASTVEGGSGTLIHNDVLDSPRTGSALKVDEVSPIYEINPKTGRPQIVKEFPATAQAHGFNDLVDNYAGYATKTSLGNADLYQLDGYLNGVPGRFEWIIQDGSVTHRMFIQNGTMNGVSIKP